MADLIIPTIPWPWPSDYGTRIQTAGIVVHHTGGQTTVPWRNIDLYHRSLGWGGIGYNVGIDVDGSVTVFGSLDDWRAHTYGYNSMMVGVCFMAVDQPNALQIAVGRVVVLWLRSVYGQQPLYRHGDLVNTTCPGPWDINILEAPVPHGPVTIPSELWTFVQRPEFIDHLDQLWGVANELDALDHSVRAQRIRERIIAIKTLFGL
jgi:N-acetylmuramoyl-L-alanine amidase-like protein